MSCLIKQVSIEEKLRAYETLSPKQAEASISGYTTAGCYTCKGDNTRCEYYVPKGKKE